MPRLANRGRRSPRGDAPRGARAMLRGVGWGRGYRRAVRWAVGKTRLDPEEVGLGPGPRGQFTPLRPRR